MARRTKEELLLERKTIEHRVVLCSGAKLHNIFKDGIFPKDSYIKHQYGSTCYVCWKVLETDEEYDKRIKDHERKLKLEAAKKRNAELLKIKKENEKKEKDKQEELALLRELVSKYPEVVFGENQGEA